jgi:release factor glutamine methyltransferase
MALAVAGSALLDWRRAMLALGGSADALDWLLDLQGGVGWQNLQRLRLSPERSVTLKQSLGNLEKLWREHLESQRPLQYLVGLCPWRDLELHVGPGVLIPRQETEVLIDLALEICPPTQSSGPVEWADLGTGSGCLALAMAWIYPKGMGYAVDCSETALQQAAVNLSAPLERGKVELRCGSWWEPLQDRWGRLQLVVSNPPYIPTQIWRELEPVVREHEPELALNGGHDGLDAIRIIAKGAAEALAPGGSLLLEHHHDQSAAVLALLKQAGLEAVEAHRDLEGVARFASARRPLRALSSLR